MSTSAANRVSPSNTVTPDCVLQFDRASGLVAETKLSLPKSEQTWDRDIQQLEKYDDDLAGWWTPDERISTHDLVALVPLARAVRFADRIEAGTKEGKWRFARKIAVVGFFKTSGIKDFLSLKKERGSVSRSDLDERLRESRQVDIALLLTHYRDRKLVDHMPPLPYLLQIMWDHLFTRYAGDISPDGPKGRLTLPVSVEGVTLDLQDYFGSKSGGARSPGIPPSQWVKKALDALVAFKLAAPSGEGQYVVTYKRTRGDTLRKFGKLCFDLDRKSQGRPTGQALLFQNAADDSE